MAQGTERHDTQKRRVNSLLLGEHGYDVFSMQFKGSIIEADMCTQCYFISLYTTSSAVNTKSILQCNSIIEFLPDAQ